MGRYIYVDDPPEHSDIASALRHLTTRPHPDNSFERALKLLDKLEKKRLKKEDLEKKKKVNKKDQWLPNPDYEDKARTFTIAELTAVLAIGCFPIAAGQILLLQWIARLILPH